jgi:pSer/pThr/pTyr-binding forkhead associated (FHA) protein
MLWAWFGACEGERAGRLFMLRVTVSVRGRILSDRDLKGPKVTIGRDPGSTIHLDNPVLSRRHAKIDRTLAGWELRDLESCNGVFVNGERKAHHVLNDGDRVAMGRFVLSIRCDVPACARLPQVGDVEAYLAQGPTVLLPYGTGEVDSSQRSGPPPPQAYISVSTPSASVHVIRRDTFVIGAGRACDLRLKGLLASRTGALVIRGRSGFSLVNTSPRPTSVYRNGKPVTSRCWLRDGDRFEIGPVFACFREGAVPKSTRRVNS